MGAGIDTETNEPGARGDLGDVTSRSAGRPRPGARNLALGIALLVAVAAVMLFVPKVRQVTSSTGTDSGGSLLPVAPGTAGTTASGSRCGPGIHQIPGNTYTPICLPKFTGNNHGATSPGVTHTKITLTYRYATSSVLQELYALVPQDIIGTNSNTVHTMEEYIKYFNSTFELYGRKVVLQQYQGKGNFIEEDTGSDLSDTNADALSVADQYHAFADMSIIDSSLAYETDLARSKVVSFGLYLEPQSWYRQNQPYAYTPGPNCTKGAQAAAAVLGKQLSGLPAIYAGNASLRAKTRKFGLIQPNQPTANTCAQDIVGDLGKFGVGIATRYSFNFNLAQLIPEMQSAAVAMKKAGVTTVILSSTDPVSPIFLMSAAANENYYPEWYMESYFGGPTSSLDAIIRNYGQQAHSPRELQGLIATGQAAYPDRQQPGYQIYVKENGSANGITPSFNFVYSSLLFFYDALQAAGPDLTPQTVEQGLANTAELRASAPGGPLGGWAFGPDTFDPASDFQVLRWNGSRVSPLDGKRGTALTCDGGRVFSYADASAEIPSHQQLGCGG